MFYKLYMLADNKVNILLSDPLMGFDVTLSSKPLKERDKLLVQYCSCSVPQAAISID